MHLHGAQPFQRSVELRENLQFLVCGVLLVNLVDQLEVLAATDAVHVPV